MEHKNYSDAENSQFTINVPFKVSSADADMFSRLKISSLVNMLIQSATISADSLNVGYGSIRQQELFWVLSRLTFEILKPLSWYDMCYVETWPKDVQKILYIRDFIVRDQKGDIVVRATSGWLGIDFNTKRPGVIDGTDSAIFARLKDKKALIYNPEKLMPVKDGNVSEVKPTYFDIDLNGHVTATRYIDWMMDTFTEEFHSDNYPKQISINYLNETFLSEQIEIKKNLAGENSFVFEGFNKNRNINAFRGKIIF